MGVMMLAAGLGSTVELETDGADEAGGDGRAREALRRQVRRGRVRRWTRSASTVCFTMHGIGVSGGIAIGHAHLFAGMSAEVDHYEIAGARRPARAAPLRPRGEGSARGAEGARRQRAPQRGRRAGAVREGAPDAARRRRVHRGAARDHPRAPLQRRVGAAHAAGRADRAVRRHRGSRTCASARTTCARWPSACWRRSPARKRRIADEAACARTPPILVARDLSPADVILFREHPFARVHHRPGRRHLAHGDRGALDEHPGDRGAAPRAHPDPRGRADRRSTAPRAW